MNTYTHLKHDFNEFVNDTMPAVQFYQRTYTPAKILKTLSPTDYRKAVLSYSHIHKGTEEEHMFLLLVKYTLARAINESL